MSNHKNKIYHIGPLADIEILEFFNTLSSKDKRLYWRRLGYRYDYNTFVSSKVLVIEAYKKWITHKIWGPKNKRDA